LERVFWGIGGLGACATLLLLLITKNERYDSVSLLSVLIVFVITRYMMIMSDINQKMYEIIDILLEEEEDDQIFHPPYDIELPEDAE
jgi:hypothetical protein